MEFTEIKMLHLISTLTKNNNGKKPLIKAIVLDKLSTKVS